MGKHGNHEYSKLQNLGRDFVAAILDLAIMDPSLHCLRISTFVVAKRSMNASEMQKQAPRVQFLKFWLILNAH